MIKFESAAHALHRSVRGFLRKEDGAVTVDWVVLTAAIAILGILSVSVMREPLASTSGAIADVMTSASGWMTATATP